MTASFSAHGRGTAGPKTRGAGPRLRTWQAADPSAVLIIGPAVALRKLCAYAMRRALTKTGSNPPVFCRAPRESRGTSIAATAEVAASRVALAAGHRKLYIGLSPHAAPNPRLRVGAVGDRSRRVREPAIRSEAAGGSRDQGRAGRNLVRTHVPL